MSPVLPGGWDDVIPESCPWVGGCVHISDRTVRFIQHCLWAPGPLSRLSARLRMASSGRGLRVSIATPTLVVDQLWNEASDDLFICVCVCLEELCGEHIFATCQVSQARFTVYSGRRQGAALVPCPCFLWVLGFLYLPLDVTAAGWLRLCSLSIQEVPPRERTEQGWACALCIERSPSRLAQVGGTVSKSISCPSVYTLFPGAKCSFV